MGAQQGKSYTAGFHVVNVTPGSPGEEAGIVSFFDYIVAANGILLDKDGSFAEILKENIEKPVEIFIYNSKEDSTRATTVVPRNWGGKGLLGLSIRFCSNLKAATEQVWHILDVYPNSPASAAGLISNSDYVIGTPDIVSPEEAEDLFTLIAQKHGETVKLYIYNSDRDEIRLVEITPNRNWGGQGSLGCDIGYGLLHKIPRSPDGTVKKTTVRIPPEQLQPSRITASAPTPQDSATPPAASVQAEVASPPATQQEPVPLVSYAPPVAPSSTVFTPAAPAPLPTTTAVPPAVTAPVVSTTTPIVPPTIPSTAPAPAATSSIPSAESLQKRLEELRIQQQRLQELRNKQLGTTSTSPSTPPASSSTPATPVATAPVSAPSTLPASTSDPSVAQTPLINASTLAALKLQALAAKQQQQ